MPAKPKPVVAKRPAPPCPDGTPARLWAFPERLAQFSRDNDLSQDELATKAGVTQSTVSRWLSYETIEKMRAAHLVALEDSLGLDPGFLTADGSRHRTNANELINAARKKQPKLLSARLGLPTDYTSLLAEPDAPEGQAMDQLPEELKRAVLGIVYLKGHPIDVVMKRAAVVQLEHGDKQHSVEFWAAALEEGLPKRPASGERPSARSLKVGTTTKRSR